MRRALIGLGVVLALLATAGIYFLYAPKPAPPPAGVDAVSVEVGGRQRRYLVFAPPRLRPGASLLLAFHSSESSGADLRRMVGEVLERIATRSNALVVYPDGYEGHFNDCRRVASYSARILDVDDVGFARQIVRRLIKDSQVDPARVYAVGYSNGGHMAIRLALEASDAVRGAVAIAASLPAPENMDCRTAGLPAPTMVFVAGTQDPINPYEGGPVSLFGFGKRGNVLSARQSAEWYAGILGLALQERSAPEQAADISAREEDWTGANGHVRLVTVEGGGHTVPQARYRFPRILGATYRSDSVLESGWKLLTGEASRTTAVREEAT